MEKKCFIKEMAEVSNAYFDIEINKFLLDWVQTHEGETLLRFEQTIDEYLANDALRDFFLNTQHPIRQLLNNDAIANHLGRSADVLYFDPVNGNPLLARSEQRIYNLGRRMECERMHIPFRFIHPNKQTEAGDDADVDSYPADSEVIRYNSGNYFVSRPANGNVFDEHSKRCREKSAGNLHIFFKRGFLEDRLHDVKELMLEIQKTGNTDLQFFVIYSRHSPVEGHFGVSLVIMDPASPDFPQRVLVCDTLLKELPHHPRWWNHFVAEYSQVFGDGVAEMLEDLSHPLQKVNIKGDDPYRHDWDCPYYAASMADALADLVITRPELILSGKADCIHDAMKDLMQDYYQQDLQIKERSEIKLSNRIKRWNSGRELIYDLISERNLQTSFQQG